MNIERKYIAIEETLNEYVEEFGGTIVERILLNPTFVNADYLFKDFKVIAELKTLEKDFFADKKHQVKIHKLYDEWVDKGLAPRIRGKAKIETKDLPIKCQREFANILKKPLERIVSKANKQIKQTKNHFRLDEYKGVLILVNDGNYSIESSAIMYLLSRIVNTQCTGIDSIIYFTVNMRGNMPNIDKDVLVWVDQNRNDVEGASGDFLKSFRDGWFEFIENKMSEAISIISIEEHEKLEEIRFIKDKLR